MMAKLLAASMLLRPIGICSSKAIEYRENNAWPTVDATLRAAAVCCGFPAVGVVLTATLGGRALRDPDAVAGGRHYRGAGAERRRLFGNAAYRPWTSEGRSCWGISRCAASAAQRSGSQRAGNLGRYREDEVI